MGLKGTQCEDMHLIHLAQDRTVCEHGTEPLVPIKVGKSFNYLSDFAFQKGLSLLLEL